MPVEQAIKCKCEGESERRSVIMAFALGQRVCNPEVLRAKPAQMRGQTRAGFEKIYLRTSKPTAEEYARCLTRESMKQGVPCECRVVPPELTKGETKLLRDIRTW